MRNSSDQRAQKKLLRSERFDRTKRECSLFFYEIFRRAQTFVTRKLFRMSDKKRTLTASASRRREKGFIFFMLSFAVINFLVFWLYVNFNSILMAFQTYDELGNLIWGFGNFREIFQNFAAGVEHLGESVTNTVKFFLVNILVIFPVSIFISFMIYKKIWGYRFYRVVFFLPSIISAVVLTAIFKTFIHSETGPLLPILDAIGIPGVLKLNLLGDSRYALNTIIGYCIWTGFATNMVLFNGAMSRIPEEVVESAKLDGAGIFRELFRITIPMIWPTMSTLIVFATVGIFSSSGPIMLFTNGDYNTYTLSYLIFAKVYYSGSAWFPYTSALGLIFTVVGVPIVIFVKWLLSKIGQDVEY